MQLSKKIMVYPYGKVFFYDKEYPCALGKSGVKEGKWEGDGATPAGCFPIREVYYRKDRIGEFICAILTHVTEPHDAWCDDPTDPQYNRHITANRDHPETLWREDHVYDIVVVLGYNDNPPVPGKGSAIFMHVARKGYTPTAGCIALSKNDLLEILDKVIEGTEVCIQSVG